MKKPKNRSGVIYSTNPDFQYNDPVEETAAEIPFSSQKLRILLDKSGRAGKTVTLVDGFSGPSSALETLGKEIKNHCGTGGSVKDGQILIQGDQRQKIAAIMVKKGASVKVL